MKARGLGGIAFCALCAASLLAFTQPGDILMGRNDPSGTGANPHESILTPAALATRPFGRLWSYPVAGFVYAQPLVISGVQVKGGARDLLIVATTANQVCAFDIASSSPKPIWRRDLTPGAKGDSGTCAPSPQAGKPVLDPNFTGHLAPTVGVLSTPVIDATTGLIYVLSRAVVSNAGSVQAMQTLYAISVKDGSIDRSAAICKSAADCPGVIVYTGQNPLRFDPLRQINRPGLALVNNLVIVMWGAFLDGSDEPRMERGWVLAFDKVSLGLRGVFCSMCFDKGLPDPSSPVLKYKSRTGGMIWQSGRPPAAWGDRYLYFLTGNALDSTKQNPAASCPSGPGTQRAAGDYSESLVVLDTSAAGQWSSNKGVVSWSPSDWCQLDHEDLDLGGSGPMLLPHVKRVLGNRMLVPGPPFVFGGGKAGILYNIDTGKISGAGMTEGRTLRTQAVLQCVNVSPNLGPGTLTNLVVRNTSPPLCQEPNTVKTGHIMGGPVFLPDVRPASLSDSTQSTGTLFIGPENMPVLAYRVSAGMLLPDPVTGGPFAKSSPDIASGHPGGILSLSADAETQGSGIIWVSHHLDPPRRVLATRGLAVIPDNNSQTTMMKGALEALDATKLQLLWSSRWPAAKGGWDFWYQKFTPPTISHGKVFLCVAPDSPTPDVPTTGEGGSYNAATGNAQVVVLGFQH